MDYEIIAQFQKSTPGYKREAIIQKYNIDENQLFDILKIIIGNNDKIKRKKCDTIIQNSSDINEIKEALFQKLFG